MSFLDFNKLAGAVLLAALLLMVIGVIGDLLVSPSELGAADVKVAAREPAKKPAAKATALAPVGPLLASASAERGAKVFRKCAGCHAAAKGGRNKVGPNLWNVVDGARAAAGGFSYSKALKAKAGKWSYESLNAFLSKPKSYLPGTKMAFAGVKKAQDRADLIAYLRSRADSPASLP